MPCSLLSQVYKTPHSNQYYHIPISNAICFDDPINNTELTCASNMNWKICAEICWKNHCCNAFARRGACWGPKVTSKGPIGGQKGPQGASWGPKGTPKGSIGSQK